MNTISEHDQILIDKYLRSSLTTAERAEFDERMQDPGFAAHVDAMREIQTAVAAEGRDGLRQMLRMWDRTRAARRLPLMRIGVAAAAVIVLLLGVYFLLPQDRPDSLASAYLEPYPNVVAPIEKGDQGLSEFEQAFQLYEAGRYTRAEKIFATLDQRNHSVQFYRAINHLMAGDDEAAMTALQHITADQGHAYFKPAMWYLALAQINLGRLDEARATLRYVVLGGEPFSGKAEELMNAF